MLSLLSALGVTILLSKH